MLNNLVMSKIAKNIRILRALRGLSQEQLAIQLDIPRSRIGSYEEGRAEPPCALLVQLSDFFFLRVKLSLVRTSKIKICRVFERKSEFFFVFVAKREERRNTKSTKKKKKKLCLCKWNFWN